MIQNGSKNFASSLSNPRDAFAHLELLLHKCPHVLANLEGPVTSLGMKHSPSRYPLPAYSFNMDPSSPQLLKQVGITHVGRGNNHLYDRGEQGVQDTHRYLQAAQLPYFGCGLSKQQAATPTILEMQGYKIGITAFSDQYKVIAGESSKNQTGVLPVTKEHAQLGQELLDPHQPSTRIAYVHWGKNYGTVSDKMRNHATILAQYGYDFIVGSDGSHTVQPFEFLENGTPVLYNVGNFIFQTPGRFRGMKPYMPFGSVLHVHFDDATGKVKSLELYCTLIDNREVEYQPQLCSPSQAESLFQSLGKHWKHTKGTVYATVNMQKNEN
jgi:poly-gamma-glutamate capsule biosynthesis protein CapA/YwtB (metallophosphatase superfamily)